MRMRAPPPPSLPHRHVSVSLPVVPSVCVCVGVCVCQCNAFAYHANAHLEDRFIPLFVRVTRVYDGVRACLCVRAGVCVQVKHVRGCVGGCMYVPMCDLMIPRVCAHVYLCSVPVCALALPQGPEGCHAPLTPLSGFLVYHSPLLQEQPYIVATDIHSAYHLDLADGQLDGKYHGTGIVAPIKVCGQRHGQRYVSSVQDVAPQSTL